MEIYSSFIINIKKCLRKDHKPPAMITVSTEDWRKELGNARDLYKVEANFPLQYK